MGKAIILSDVNFSSVGLGVVTPYRDNPVTGLNIVSPLEIIGESYQLGIEYTPVDTTQRGVLWSIVSGSQYASVDNDGNVTISESANNSTIVVKATSTYNSSVNTEKTIVVTYHAATLWDEALADADCAVYMNGKGKLYEKTDELVLSGNTLGTPVTQPITSLSQSYFVLFDVTFESQVSSATAPCLFARMGDNFNICCHPDTSAKVWMAQPNFGGSYVGIQLGLGGRTFAGRVKMMVYYDRANKKMWAKNLTNGNIVPLSSVGSGGGTLRPEVYLFGGTDVSNGFKGTIHSFFIGG